MNSLPNILSALRFLGAIGLLFFNPVGAAFWVIYGFCGISDMLDGYLARKLHAESKAGALLDSVADICFVACCAIRLIPVMPIPTWLWIWAGVFWSFISLAFVAGVATFAAIQEGTVIFKNIPDDIVPI